MARFVAALLACLFVLSGCVQPPMADDPTPPAVESDDFPPGVTTDGISNASQLLDAHVETLGETGWRSQSMLWTRAPHYDFEGVGVTVETETVTATPDMAEIRYRTDTQRTFPDRSESVVWDRWYDGPSQYTQLRCPSGELIYHSSSLPHHLELVRITRLPVYGWLRAGDYDLAEIEHAENRTLFTYVADEESAWGRTRNGTFENGTVVVDSAGRIHHLDSTVRWTTDDGIEVTRRDRYELLEIGVSDLESPEWIETAKREVTDSGCDTPNANG